MTGGVSHSGYEPPRELQASFACPSHGGFCYRFSGSITPPEHLMNFHRRKRARRKGIKKLFTLKSEKGESIMAISNEQIAKSVVDAVGGKANITFVTHCMTRLRFTLKDNSLPNQEEVKGLKGVLGVVVSGGQFQVIIGQNVPKVYTEVCRLTGLEAQEAVNENLDAPKEKLTPKKVGSNILNYLSGSIAPLIPIIMAAAMFKTLLAILGSDMLGLISSDSNLAILFDFVYDAGFYFFPVYLGYTAAKKLNTSIPLGMFLGGILIAPDFVALAGSDVSFSVYGIPCAVNSYSSTIVPILLSVWIMSYVYKFFAKYVPTVISTIFTPFCTIAVMLPVSLCVMAPLGNFIGQYLASFMNWFSSVGGGLAVGVMGAAYCFLVMTGMHGPIVLMAIAQLVATGTDTLVFIGGSVSMFACCGMALGAALRQKDKEDRALSISCLLTGLLSGITEPSLYGIGIRYKKPFIGMAIGGLVGGLYAGFTHVTYHVMISILVLSPLSYTAGGTANMINATIANVLALAVSAMITFFLGLNSKETAVKAS